jgi:hypothetical protein
MIDFLRKMIDSLLKIRAARFRIVMALFALLLLWLGGGQVVSYLRAPLDRKRTQAAGLAKRIEKASAQLRRTKKAAEDLRFWQECALPSDPVAARSEYQAWLLDLVGRTELAGPSVSSGEPALRGNLYYTISFSLQASGTLEQWTRFLFDFYRAGHLHQIRSIGITPIGRKDEVTLSLAIEALALPNADRIDRLTAKTADRLAFDSLEDYRVIAERNLFGLSGLVDPVDLTYLTAINSVNGVPKAWFTLQTETEPDRSLVKLAVGETLQIGHFRGTVIDIDREDVILEAAGQRWLVAVGESLAEALALPPGLYMP